MIDSHTHIYSEEFNADRNEVVKRAQEAGIRHVILPNIDFDSFDDMHALHADFPEYTSLAMGFHPESVTANSKELLYRTCELIASGRYVAVGEIGIDLYWDETYRAEQIEAFALQVDTAYSYNLPVIIHCRKALNEVLSVIRNQGSRNPQYVFHSFTGTPDEVREIRKYVHPYFGINGIATFKKSNLGPTMLEIGIDNILLETDSPYLAPVPMRGKRNESAFMPYVAHNVAEVFGKTTAEVDKITDDNTVKFFNLPLKAL